MKQKPTLSHQKILTLDRNYRQAAKAARLIYVSDSKPGILRHKKSGGYTYSFSGKMLKDKKQLEASAVKLTEALIALKQQEQLNIALIQQSMQFVQLSLDLLSPSLTNMNYGKEQKDQPINRSVFDSKA